MCTEKHGCVKIARPRPDPARAGAARTAGEEEPPRPAGQRRPGVGSVHTGAADTGVDHVAVHMQQVGGESTVQTSMLWKLDSAIKKQPMHLGYIRVPRVSVRVKTVFQGLGCIAHAVLNVEQHIDTQRKHMFCMG